MAGPYQQLLDNAGGRIQLLRPDGLPVGPLDSRPMVLVDEATYDSIAPWPPGSVQTGNSLARTQPGDFGNYPTSWRRGIPSPGAADWVVRRPGDANEDGQFDQEDLGQLLAEGAYRTGQAATWGQGDWTGDGRFDPRDIVAALQAGAFLATAQAADGTGIVDRAVQEMASIVSFS